ncbi:MAG TPA: YceI family protein [Candidatus Binatus sp.]|nr:YceI family protein [Candidatus Binatus sp.]
MMRSLSAVAAAFMVLVCAVAPAWSAVGDVTWSVDPGHSIAEFSVVHLGVTHVHGSILITQASVVTPAQSLVPTTIDAALDPASIDTRNSDRDSDLRGPQWLDVTNFKTMTFKSTDITAGPSDTFTANGQLTIHGVTKTATLAGHVDGTTVDGRGHHRVSYSASTTIKRQDFGLNWAQQTPGGTFVAGDNVEITISIEAVTR